MHPSLATARLLLRPMELADAPQIQALFPQWEIVRHLANVVPWPYPPDGAETFIRGALANTERDEAWHWTIRRKSDPEQIIGAIGLMRTGPSNRGFWIAPPWQRQGYASEACEAVTAYWFKVLKFEKLRVPKAAANMASRRISEKQGMRVVAVQESDYVSGRLSTEIWEITREEWLRRSNSGDEPAPLIEEPGFRKPDRETP